MQIISIVGARPQFVKLAPVSRAFANASVADGVEIKDMILHTGQHYDPLLSDVFFDELQIPRPTFHLEVGSGSHGVQTAKMLESIESVLLEQRPDMVVIYGDTNSAVAGALAAAKLHIPVAHVEAGLRSFNRLMPEEINRVISDHVSDLLFAPTETAMFNLSNENLASRSFLTGDVMLDAVNFNATKAEESSRILTKLGLESEVFAVATLHRASNTEADKLVEMFNTLNQIASELIPIVFPIHPRTVAMLAKSGVTWRAFEGLRMIDPIGYPDMLKLLNHARLVLTDSGGLQKEALFVGTPCVTLREETEWPETVSAGSNIVTGTDSDRIIRAVEHWLNHDGATKCGEQESIALPFGDGNAAAKIVEKIVSYA